MPTKKCSTCSLSKPLCEFTRDKHHCNHCVSAKRRLYCRSKKGFLSRVYHHQVRNSKSRAHVMPSYTMQEFRDMWIDNREFLILYNQWVGSGYKKAASPSFDRIDNNLPYTFGNIQVVTWGENNSRSHRELKDGTLLGNHRRVRQLLLDGSVVNTFYSIKEAERRTPNAQQQHIVHCCKGQRKTHAGYRWQYA